ncbi:hypothetical protein JCM10213_001664 [Rhodosporidiobolus nylandii]
MLPAVLLSALAAASVAQAAPFFSTKPVVKRDGHSDKASLTITDVQIHESCNAAQTNYLRNGLDEMNKLAKHAHDRILRLGEEDELYRTYFGNASSASTSGFYAQMLWANKPGVLLLCNDPDDNCKQTTAAGPWAGHWRGSNGTLETVICPPTYTRRLHLSTLCWDEHKIGVTAPSTWLAADLLHRMTHIPSIIYDHVVHAADDYPDVLALAANNDTAAAFNQNTFHALDAYARDVAYPPYGCVGSEEEIAAALEGSSSYGSASSSAASTSATATATATTTSEEAHETHHHASETTTAAANCHTHASDGVVHCD